MTRDVPTQWMDLGNLKVLMHPNNMYLHTEEGSVMWIDPMHLPVVRVQFQKSAEEQGQQWKPAKYVLQVHNKYLVQKNYVCIFPNLPCMRYCFLTLKLVPEKKSLDQLCHDLYTYLWLKQNSKSRSNFVGLQEYFALTRPREDEKSNIVYFDVLNAVADKKETVLLVLDKLRKQIVERHGKQWLVVAGDAKLYDVLKTIKHEYGDEFKWLICYPGDWHMS